MCIEGNELADELSKMGGFSELYVVIDLPVLLTKK